MLSATEGFEAGPIMGHISGDCLEKEDDLCCDLWGGNYMSPYLATFLIKLTIWGSS